MKKEETKPYVPSEEAETILNGYRLLDDDFMKIFFDQNFEATELILRIILNRNDIVVKTINSQKVEISPLLGGRNIVLDIFAMPWIRKTRTMTSRFKEPIGAQEEEGHDFTAQSLIQECWKQMTLFQSCVTHMSFS